MVFVFGFKKGVRIQNSGIRIILIFSLLLIVIAGCTSGETERPEAEIEQDIEAIREMSSARAEAFRNGDAAAIARHFTEDGILMAPGEPTQIGREAVDAYYKAIFDVYHTELDSYYEEVLVSGDLGFGRGFAEVTLRARNGDQTLSSTSKYINIVERQEDGSWKTTHDIWNANE